MELTKNSKIAVVCCGGPENGPFSAQFLSTFRRGLENSGMDIAGIYAVSGSSTTALLGSIHDEERLCKIWRSLTPEDIIGDFKLEALPHSVREFLAKTVYPKRFLRSISRWNIIIRNIRQHAHAFNNKFLIKLLRKHVDSNSLDRIFSPEAILAKVAAVDYLTGERLIFSNKIPEHKPIYLLGIAGSMGLVPWFNSITIEEPVNFKLLEKPHPDYNAVFMMDGGYRGNILLDEAIKEPCGYDLILIVDIRGLKIKNLSKQDPFNVATRIERVVNIITETNYKLIISLVDRIDEGIRIKKLLQALAMELPPEFAEKLGAIIAKMDFGRLKLADKYNPERLVVSSPENYSPFNFADFKPIEIVRFLQAGHDAALKTLQQLGVSTANLPLIDPAC